jgi:hypothetical protein
MAKYSNKKKWRTQLYIEEISERIIFQLFLGRLRFFRERIND